VVIAMREDTRIAAETRGEIVELGGDRSRIRRARKFGDAVFDEIFHPIARELIGKCDAVLRIGGPSTGADDMVATGRKLGKRIFRDLAEIPERARA